MNHNNKLLIITPYFAPQSHAAVFRAYKLAKYLPALGWQPFVLTVDTNYLYNEDPSLLEALPKEVKIIKSRYVEPTLRGLRMAMGGKSRSFKNIKSSEGSASGEVAAASPLKKLYQGLVRNYLHSPDAYWSWQKSALNAAEDIMAKEGVKLVFTTCPPFSNNVIGRQLQKSGAKWVADFRDPGAYNMRTFSKSDSVFLKQRSIERETVLNADALTIASSAFQYIFNDMYGNSGNPIEFIPTGMDDALLNLKSSKHEISAPYFIFSGEFMPEYDDFFFQVFKQLVPSNDIKLVFVGRKEINAPRAMPHIQKHGLEDKAIFIDHIPQQDLYLLIKKSLGALLIPGRDAYWWNLFAKLVDYIALDIPIIGVLPEISEARRVVERCGRGVLLDGTVENAVNKLKEFLAQKNVSPVRDSAYRERFLATNMVKSFIDVFNKI